MRTTSRSPPRPRVRQGWGDAVPRGGRRRLAPYRSARASILSRVSHLISTSIYSDDDAKQEDDDDDDDNQRVLLLLTPVTAASQLAHEFDELDTA